MLFTVILCLAIVGLAAFNQVLISQIRYDFVSTLGPVKDPKSLSQATEEQVRTNCKPIAEQLWKLGYWIEQHDLLILLTGVGFGTAAI